MRHGRVLVALIAGAIIALPAALFAQSSTNAPRAKQPRVTEPEYEVEELTPGQIRRAQEQEQREQQQRNTAPARTAAPAATAVTSPPPRAATQATPATPAAVAAPPPSTPAAMAAGRTSIACNGVWSKDASHIKLANVFKLDNVAFTDVDGGSSGKVMATVLFPKDPKRRLEVWWKNETSRSGLYLIVINGQSTWSVPKGLKLGLGLAAVEKLNVKPFKLKGFDKDGGNTVDWNGGQLGSLPGDCKVGLKFAADPKAPRDEVMNEREFESSDAAMRAARPTISEIILGY